MRTCSYCGKETEDQASFCVGCGDSLDNPSQSFPTTSIEQRRRRDVFARAGLVIGIIGTGFIAAISCPSFFLPYGTPIRPMGWVITLYLTAIGSFLIGLPCALIGATSSKRLIGWLGVVLTVAPGPLGYVMLHIAVALRGLQLEP